MTQDPQKPNPSETFDAPGGNARPDASTTLPETQSDTALTVDTDQAKLPAITPKAAATTAQLNAVDEARTKRLDAEKALADAALEEHRAKADAGVGDALPLNNYRGLDSAQINAISDPESRTVHLAAFNEYQNTVNEDEQAQQELESYGRYVPVNQAREILKAAKGE